jgi:hypothetical protein
MKLNFFQDAKQATRVRGGNVQWSVLAPHQVSLEVVFGIWLRKTLNWDFVSLPRY